MITATFHTENEILAELRVDKVSEDSQEVEDIKHNDPTKELATEEFRNAMEEVPSVLGFTRLCHF